MTFGFPPTAQHQHRRPLPAGRLVTRRPAAEALRTRDLAGAFREEVWSIGARASLPSCSDTPVSGPWWQHDDASYRRALPRLDLRSPAADHARSAPGARYTAITRRYDVASQRCIRLPIGSVTGWLPAAEFRNSVRGGILVFGYTTEPAVTIAPAPTCTRSKTTALAPITAPLATVQP